MKWYTLNTKPHAEYQVADSLRQRHLEIFLPEIETRTFKNLLVPKPFFPGYLFVKFDLNQTGLSVIQWTPGLRRLVMFDSHPCTIPERIIELIRQKVAEFGADGKNRHPFKPGDTVRITAGPFSEMLATFDQAVTGAERVQVLLNILGHASRVQLAAAELEKVNNNLQPPPLKRPRRTRGRGRRIKQTP